MTHLHGQAQGAYDETSQDDPTRSEWRAFTMKVRSLVVLFAPTLIQPACGGRTGTELAVTPKDDPDSAIGANSNPIGGDAASDSVAPVPDHDAATDADMGGATNAVCMPAMTGGGSSSGGPGSLDCYVAYCPQGWMCVDGPNAGDVMRTPGGSAATECVSIPTKCQASPDCACMGTVASECFVPQPAVDTCTVIANQGRIAFLSF